VTNRRVLVLGGARSGKSTFAERMAAESGMPVLYVATATPGDEEMAERIAMHRAQRPRAWRTLEIPVGVAAKVAAELRKGRPDTAHGTTSVDIDPPLVQPRVDTEGACGMIALVEDLTFLLSNLMAEDVSQAEARALQEVSALLALPADIIVVSNEVGLGLVPPYPLGRRFRDALGRVNQFAAAACQEVYIMFAGLPLQLK
jgi:adenosylcobinamide kinase/adenosylcobinamide-phosphate guanylyltransferase